MRAFLRPSLWHKPARAVQCQQQQMGFPNAITTRQAGYVSIIQEDGQALPCSADPIGSDVPGQGFATSYVWRPGGTASPGVYITWAALVAAFATADPAAYKVVSVDDSIAAAHITTGAWANCENIRFRSAGLDSGPGTALANVIIDQGASLTGVTHIALETCLITYNGSSGSFITTAANTNLVIVSDGGNILGGGLGGAGFATAGAGATISYRGKVSAITGQLFAGSATSTVFLIGFDGTTIGPNVVNATAGCTVLIEVDGSSVGSATQTPAPSIAVFDPTPTFVFQPSATTPGGNVFSTWAALMSAMALCPGQRFVYVDDSIAAAHATVGTFDVNNVTFFGNFNAGETLIIDSGCIWTTSSVEFRNGIVAQSNSATPTISVAAGKFCWVRVLEGSMLTSGAAGPFGSVLAGGEMSVKISDKSSTAGDATHAVFTNANQLFIEVWDGGTLAANATAGASTRQCTYGYDSIVNDTAALLTLNFVPTANFVQAAANTGTGTGTTTAVTGNIQRKKTGKVTVTGLATGTVSAATTTVTVSLLRDATPILTLPALTEVTTASFAIPIDFIDTLPDFAAHTYTVKAVAAAGNITTGAGGNTIQAQEI